MTVTASQLVQAYEEGYVAGQAWQRREPGSTCLPDYSIVTQAPQAQAWIRGHRDGREDVGRAGLEPATNGL